jgi:hypothetical protein
MPVATPIPKSTPTRRSRPRPKSTPVAAPEEQSATNAPAAAEKPETNTGKPTAEQTPAKPADKKGADKKSAAGDQPPAPEKTKEQKALDEAMASGDANDIEKAKYDEVKARASADPRVKELKEKADAALTDEEGRKALRAYNKALFQKMRSLDGSIKTRIDEMEAAVMKRLQP